ncbi:MAG TPA: DUF6599 family protein [Acidobacteriaceae bacterium]|nr:DUF6599 family protein [Acidobacteriaceae bacterium]
MFRPSCAVRLLVIAFCTVLMLFPAFAQKARHNNETIHKQVAAPSFVSAPVATKGLLPETFAGWQMAGVPQHSTNSRAADDGDAASLQEYGFTRYEAANYTRGGDSLALKAIQFADATGAYGAFTFYRRSNMAPESIGRGAAFDGARVLFWNGTVLVDAKFNRLTPMSASELRDLATELPQPVGNQGVPPRLPQYLPPNHLEAMTVQYAIGPQAYGLSGGVLPASLVDFNRSAEVVTAQYNALNGIGTLTIINYPTPEIATDREHAIQTYFDSHGAGGASTQTEAQNSWTPALADSNPAALRVRRSGPLVAVTSGSFSADAAEQLLQQVHYEVNLTMGSSTKYVSDTAKVAQIILSVAFLVGIFALIAIVAGFSLGGGRILWRKMRNKSGDATEESAEFIRLNLKD